MSKKNTILKKSNIEKRMWIEYVLSLILYVVLVGLTVLVIKYKLSEIIWYDTDRLYPILHWVNRNTIVTMSLVFSVGWLVITLAFVIRTVRLLGRVVEASEKLAKHQDEPIRMPGVLKYVQDELNSLNENYKRNERMASEAVRRKEELIVYLAHDLKTPLTSVIGYLSLLDEQPDFPREQRCRYTHISLEKAERLEELINEFFDITRFNVTTMSLELSTISLSRMLEQIAYEFIPIIKNKNLTLVTKIEKDIDICCDTNKLERVVDNLFRNAINYSYENTELCFSLVDAGDNVEIKMHNHGRTIPEDKLEHIFEQFFRVDTSRATSTGGSGLGLAIASEIVKLHKGTIKAESSNETITFVVTLPKIQEQKN